MNFHVIDEQNKHESENENENENEESMEETNPIYYIHFLNFFQHVGIICLAKDVYIYFDEISLFLKYLLMACVMFGSSFLITLTGAKTLCGFYSYDFWNDFSHEESEYEKFINNDLDTLQCIFNLSPDEVNQYKKDEPIFITELKESKNHSTFELPFDPSTNVIMYYDDDDEAFHYYTKNCDIQYKVLNSICRSYVIEHTCIQLFQDEYDLNEIMPSDDDSDSDSESETKTQNEEDYEEIQEEDCEHHTNRSSLFYVKKTRKESEKEKREQSSNIDKKINKFIYKGNMIEYESLLKTPKTVIQHDVSYDAFKESSL